MTGDRNCHHKGLYRIKVKGQLGKEWSDWFEGMNISTEGGTTVLTGPIKDEAALHGILNRIRDLGIPLVSVIQIVSGSEEDAIQPEGEES